MKSGAFGSFTYDPLMSISSVPMSMEDAPRKVIVGSLFGSEPNSRLSKIINDGSKFFRLWKTFALPTRFKSSFFIVMDDPVKLSALRSKIPVTTTSSSSPNSSSIATLISNSFPTVTSLVFIPIIENTSTIFSVPGSVRLYFPFTSVAVPNCVPFSMTVTPGNGSFV